MKERNVTDIVNDIESLREEVKGYILNTEHYLFYWVLNDEIKDFIEEYPDDFEERINLELREMHGDGVTIGIYFLSEHPHNVDKIVRSASLSNFRDVTAKYYKEFGGHITNLILTELENDLNYHKRETIRCEEEIAKLKKELEHLPHE